MGITTTTVGYWSTTEEYWPDYYFDYYYEHTELSKDELSKDELRILKIVSLVIYIVVFVLGVLGNGVVIWVTGFKMKKTANTVWYLNLAVADFLFTALLPLRITERALNGHWPFGQFMCKLNSTVIFLNMYASIYILMVISVDRCVCVVRPVWAQNHRSVRKASCVSLGVWVLALALSSPYFIFKDTRPYSHVGIMCRNNFALTDDGLITFADIPGEDLVKFRLGAMILTRFLMGFVVPFTVIVSCYSVIVHRIRRNRLLASQSGRPFKIIAVVITAFFLCWAPYHILQQIRLMNVMGVGDSDTLEAIIIAFSVAYINSCLNPLLYMFMGQNSKNEVRRSVLKVLEKAFTEELPQTNTSTNPAITRQETASSETQV